MPGKVFISYSHKDEGAKDELQSHLAVAVAAGKVELWEDRQIGVGDDWEAEIEKALNECSAAILLISRNFLSSGFINGVEVPKLLQRRQEEGLRLFPVVWSACDWKAVEWLPAMNMFPRDAKPMRGMTAAKRDEQFAAFAEMVRRHIQSVENTPSADKEIREALEAIEAATSRVFAGAGPNRKPILDSILAAGIEAVKAGESASEADVFDLFDLQAAFEDETIGLGAQTFSLKGLPELQAALKALAEKSGGVVDLTPEMIAYIQEALEDVQRTLNNNLFPSCKQELQGLQRVLLNAESSRRARLGQLSQRADLIGRKDRECIEAGRIAIQVCVGLNLDKAPPLAAFRERLAVGGHAPVMVVMPIGRFLMGAPDAEKGSYDDERPQHEVVIEDRFAIGRYSVTFEEYDFYCEATGYELLNDEGWGRGRRPVIYVPWQDAITYIDWLNIQVSGEDRLVYHLPSESEWEYSCRAGTVTRYPWGDDWDSGMANCAKELNQTSEVGAYAANGYGLFDMVGNVFEWCQDAWVENYNDPHAQSPFQGDDNSSRVLRGGTWSNDPEFLRSAFRGGGRPVVRSNNVGFRLSRTLVTS